MNQKLLVLHLKDVQVKSFKRPSILDKLLDKYILALLIISPLLLIARIVGEWLAVWLMR